MSYSKRVLQCMKQGRPYREDELAAMTNIPRQEIKRVISLLLSGGLVEQAGTTTYRRKQDRIVRSRQGRLPGI